MADILDLSTYKGAKNITTTEYDTQLGILIPMINDYIEKYCNRQFGLAEYTEEQEGTINEHGNYIFFVKNTPITSVSSVSIRFIGTDTPVTVDTDELDIFENAGYMYYSHELSPSVSVIREEYRQNFYYTIVYSGGESVPGTVKLAAIQMLSDTWEYMNRTNSMLASGTQQVGELKSVKIGDYSETYATGDSLFKGMHDVKGGIVLTQTVKDLLQPYRSAGQSWNR